MATPSEPQGQLGAAVGSFWRSSLSTCCWHLSEWPVSVSSMLSMHGVLQELSGASVGGGDTFMPSSLLSSD